MTPVDWMFEHPWMTFFVAVSLTSSLRIIFRGWPRGES